MSRVFASLPVNPFEADVIREPREVAYSVPGLNDSPLNHLIAEFGRLTVGELPRNPIPSPKAQLVVSPRRAMENLICLEDFFKLSDRGRRKSIFFRSRPLNGLGSRFCWQRFKNWIVRVSTTYVRKRNLMPSQWESWLILQQISWSREE